MDLYFYKFNNYYNRIIKFYDSVSSYQQNGEQLGEPLQNCSFNPNDGIDAIHIVNRDLSEIGDYMLAVLGGEIISRWFIIEARRERTGRYHLKLRRDLFADTYSSVIKAPAFIEKATLDNGDPMIFNSEDMTFNQIKTSETPLKDETGSAWVVGYIPRDAFAESKTINGSVVLDSAYDIIEADITNWSYYRYTNEKFKGAYNLSQTKYVGYTYLSVKDRQNYMQGFGVSADGNLVLDYIYQNNANSGRIEGIESPPVTNSNLFVGESLDQTHAIYFSTEIRFQAPKVWKENITQINNYSLAYTECNTQASTNSFLNLNNKIIYESSTQTYRRIKISSEQKTETINISAGNLFDYLTNNLHRDIIYSVPNGTVLTTILGDPGNNSFKMQYTYNEYTMTLEQILTSASVTLDSDRYHLEDQPYDMFCIPYSNDFKIYQNDTELFTANKSIAINMAIEIGADAGTDAIYDVQLLPFCPVRYCIKDDGTFDIGDAKVNFIKDSDSNNIGVILWATSSAFTINIPYEIKVNNPKLENETDIYRLCSPNFNGQFEFSPAMNGGVDFFNVDCNYKPYTPYIHINPNFKNLYGQDFNDARGLICGGDFSLPQLSNAWSNYQLSNKNFQNTFDRQIENMETNNAIQRSKEALGATLGTIGGLAGGAIAGSKLGIGGIAGGAVAGGIGSALAGAYDIAMNELSRAEALDYTKDQFGYQLGNIQAIPTSLSKTSAFTYNNKIFPILEYYTCTQEEKTALENKLKYNGMTVMRIGTIQEFMKDTPTYIKGKIIRLEDTGEDFHYISELAKEFDKGVFI